MGVQGLWNLLESSSQTVPIHTLRGKVLSVDVSIWLHQAVKGYRDKDGNPLPNAHLLGVFHRICKLLNYGVKPVFVFDGGVPVLKRQTINARKQKKLVAKDKSQEIRLKMLTNLARQQVQRQLKKALPPTQQMEKVISSFAARKKSESPQKRRREMEDTDEDEFAKLRRKLEENGSSSLDSSLFSLKEKPSVSGSSSDSEVEVDYRNGRNYAEHFGLITSPNFDSLPLELQHEILFEMQESKKTNSWGKMHEMPRDLQNFSSFQMDRLVKRRFLQKKIQTVQKEMGERHIHVQSLDDLADFEAEFRSANTSETEIIGSKVRGALLIKANESLNETKPGPSSEITSSMKTGVITIDDYVEELDTDDDEVESSVQKLYFGSEDISEKFSQNQVSDEEAELQMAIAMSLQEESISPGPANARNLTPEKLNSSVEPNPTVLKRRSPTKKTVDALKREQQTQSNYLSSDFQKGSNSCYKFLGWVGFNENVVHPSFAPPTASETKSEVENAEIVNNSSTSDSDFEEVDEVVPKFHLSIEQSQNKTFSNRSPSLTSNKGNTQPVLPREQESTVPFSIKVAEDFAFKKEEDIFADIFANSNSKKETEFGDVEMQTNVSHETKIMSIKLKQDSEFKKEDMFVESFENPKLEESSKPKLDYTDIQTKKPSETFIDMVLEGEDDDFMEVVEELEFEPKLNQVLGNSSIKSTPSVIVDHERDSSENCRITKTFGTLPSQNVTRLISVDFMQSQEKLNDDQRNLQSTRGGQERIAASITDQMYIEVQELIKLFGIPYVISPMEAESQCSFLDSACLTDGTITDDSDVWLFGGQRVYKNFFLQGEKPIQFFQYADIVRHLNLDREKLVIMAILTGSDYSIGVEGVGPVLALEILTEFPGESIGSFDSLVKFREWWDSTQLEPDLKPANKIKSKLQKLKLRPGFPSKAIYDAYMEPTVDNSTEPFRWGTPNLDLLTKYVKTKFGWDEGKCDAIIGPIMKNFKSHENQGGRQTRMDDFITTTGMSVGPGQKTKVKSKRLAESLKKLKRVMPREPSELNLSSGSDSDSVSGRSGKKIINKPNSSNSKRKQSNNKKPAGKTLETQSGSTYKPPRAARIPKKVDTSIPQKIWAESRNKILKEKAAKLIKKKVQ